MTTTIYLDVDGVLNALVRFSEPSPKLTGWEVWESKMVNGWPIQYSPELITALNGLAAREDVTFKWLTTWTDDAAKKLSPAIGINGQRWEVLDGDQHAWGGKRGWWKLEAIQADVEANPSGKFIWVDDDLKRETAALEWVNGRTNGRVISPTAEHGLTRDEVSILITEWATA